MLKITTIHFSQLLPCKRLAVESMRNELVGGFRCAETELGYDERGSGGI